MTGQEQTFEAWISKYALSTGIFKVQAEMSGTSAGMIVVRGKENGAFTHHYHGEGKEWHRTREDAEKIAHIRKRAKIASLKRQIEKLETMTFTEKGK